MAAIRRSATSRPVAFRNAFPTGTPLTSKTYGSGSDPSIVCRVGTRYNRSTPAIRAPTAIAARNDTSASRSPQPRPPRGHRARRSCDSRPARADASPPARGRPGPSHASPIRDAGRTPARTTPRRSARWPGTRGAPSRGPTRAQCHALAAEQRLDEGVPTQLLQRQQRCLGGFAHDRAWHAQSRVRQERGVRYLSTAHSTARGELTTTTHAAPTCQRVHAEYDLFERTRRHGSHDHRVHRPQLGCAGHDSRLVNPTRREKRLRWQTGDKPENGQTVARCRAPPPRGAGPARRNRRDVRGWRNAWTGHKRRRGRTIIRREERRRPPLLRRLRGVDDDELVIGHVVLVFVVPNGRTEAECCWP